MKKIPTMFERDWIGGKPQNILDKIKPGCEWVSEGEGSPTKKIDGSSCLVRGGVMYKRRELVKNAAVPDGFEEVDFDPETGKTIGWVPVGAGPEDKWHREAYNPCLEAGTYELVGPMVQGNPENQPTHRLIGHKSKELIIKEPVPRTFDGLKEWFQERDIEGIVFQHKDGRMAKIKLRDFGIKRKKITVAQG